MRDIIRYTEDQDYYVEEDTYEEEEVGRGREVLSNRKILSILFDYLDPNDSVSLNIFFASKNVFSNIDVTAARLNDSHSVVAPVEQRNELRVDTTVTKKLSNYQSPSVNDNTPEFHGRGSSSIRRLPTINDLSVINQNLFRT